MKAMRWTNDQLLPDVSVDMARKFGSFTSR